MEIVSKSYLSIYGVISTYILNKALTRCNANVSFHIPDRIKEGYGIFDNMMDKISLETSQYLLKAEIRQNIERKEVAKPIINNREDGTLKGGTHKKEKIGRNDPCPCGSGKKYKQCCGK